MGFSSTLAVTMRRNAQPVRAREHLTSLLLHVLMAQSVSVQEEEQIANSTTESAEMDKDAERCVARDNLTALGGPRTGTSTTVSESSTLEILDWQQGTQLGTRLCWKPALKISS